MNFKIADPSLLQHSNKEDSHIDIKYRNRPTNNKKVRVKSAPDEEEKKVVKKGPVKISERPRWGAPNQSKQKAMKQSDREIRQKQRREAAEARRLARQQQMFEMAQRNAPRASQRTTNVSRARSHSHTRAEEADGGQNSPDYVLPTQHETLHCSQQESTIAKSHLDQESDHVSYNDNDRFNKASSRQYSHTEGRRSPPVPSIRHKLNQDGSSEPQNTGSSHERYQDLDPRSSNSNFIPFIRTQEILDPAHAADPVPLSRETTAVQRARQAYHEVGQPVNFGTHLDNIKDNASYEPVPAKWSKVLAG